MKIAILVIAAKAPSCLNQLVLLFAGNQDFEIYVHVDNRIELSWYQSQITVLPSNVRFLTERVSVYWGGFSMVHATELLAVAALKDYQTSVLCLISDDSLPLIPPDTLLSELHCRPNRLDLTPTLNNPVHLERYIKYYYLDSLPTCVSPVAVESRAINADLIATFHQIETLKRRGKYPLEAIWSGSQWWSMSRDRIEPLLAELASNDWLRESLKFSAIPDEFTFHSLYAIQYRIRVSSLLSPMLADFSSVPAPYVYKSLEQVGFLAPQKLFVRKISNDHAPLIMKQLRHLWNGDSHT